MDMRHLGRPLGPGHAPANTRHSRGGMGEGSSLREPRGCARAPCHGKSGLETSKHREEDPERGRRRDAPMEWHLAIPNSPSGAGGAGSSTEEPLKARASILAGS